MAFKQFPVIADGFNGTHRPLRIDSHIGTGIAFQPDKALDSRVRCRLLQGPDIAGCNTQLFRADEREQRPADNVEPAVVALTHHGAERLLGQNFGQNDVTVWIGQFEPLRIEPRLVRRIDIAPFRRIGGHDLVRFLIHNRRIAHAVGTEKISEVEFRRRTGIHADRGAVEFKGALEPERPADHDPLPVIIHDADEAEPERRVPGLAPGRVPRQQIDLTGLKSRKSNL